MNREQAREAAKDRIEEVLRDLYGITDTRKNFRCIAGTHEDSTPSMGYDRNQKRAHCFSCGVSWDTFDLIGHWYKTADEREKFRKTYDYLGIQVDAPERSHTQSEAAQLYDTTQSIREAAERPSEALEAPEKATADYTEYFTLCAERIQDTDYWKGRGLSLETVQRFRIGYDPKWRPVNVPNAVPASPRLIIPTGTGSYTARDTRKEIPEAARSYKNQKTGPIRNEGKPPNMFNIGALAEKSPVFVTEGETDALSILEAGQHAIALGSVAYVKTFLEAAKGKQHRKEPLLIALDHDPAGEKATRELITELAALHIPAYDARTIITQGKDPNDALIQDPEGFRAKVSAWAKDPAKESYQGQTAAAYLQGFVNGITESVNTPYIPTGYPLLDYVLDGGLFEGLYFIGAISSLGKTTFIVQMADQIAMQGNDVLFISLEMGRSEIMAKSISRLTLDIAQEQGGNLRNAKTTRGITTGSRYPGYSEEEKKLISDAVQQYAKYAGNLVIKEGIGDIGTAEIRNYIQMHIQATGRRPVVMIDYIQILAPPEGYERASDKQITDRNVTELKRISRDFKVPILGISSFNRESYNTAVSMTAFKESGAIEYSSDILIGLQYFGLPKHGSTSTEKKDNAEKIDEARRSNPRQVELVILKNRNGQVGNRIQYDYHPLFNLFRENGKRCAEYERNGSRPDHGWIQVVEGNTPEEAGY